MRVGALTYTTVFRSRLGALNLAIECSDRSFAQRARIKRSLENKLRVTKCVTQGDPIWDPLLRYLVDKGFVSKNKGGKSKYKYRYEKNEDGTVHLFDLKDTQIREAEFAIADIWLSDERVRSTIAAPTIENTDEILDFSVQTEIVSSTKGNWTSIGKLAADLRRTGGAIDNPFVLRAEIAAFVRSLFRVDGWMLKEISSRLASMPQPFTRSDVIAKFGDIVASVERIVEKTVKDKDALKEFAGFSELVRKNMKKRAEKAASETINLGVLEHRVSPRLEWLTDLRILKKAQRNAFEYQLGEELDTFLAALECLGDSEASRDEAALAFIIKSAWSQQELGHLQEQDLLRAVLKAYAFVRPSVGPARIEDVAFIAGILLRDAKTTLRTLSEYIVELAKEREEVTISGDRFTRAPRMVHIKERLWKL